MDSKQVTAFQSTAQEVKDALHATNSPRILTCLLPAIIAAMPAFLQAFMACLATGGSGDYNPGDRNRC